MKDLKRLFFIVSILIIFNISAFAKSGFEFILNVPIGASYSIISQNMKDYKMKNFFGLDAGVETQLGYMFQINEGFGISVLGDIGYSHDNYKIKYERITYNSEYAIHYSRYNFRYDGVQVGLLPKFNIKGFSIGIGCGIKFPIYKYENYDYLDVALPLASSYIVNNENSSSGEENEREPYSVIPYAKLTLDYYIFFANKWAVNIGLYCRYDFLPKYKFYDGNGYIDKPKNYGTLNFGVQLGLRFGPRV